MSGFEIVGLILGAYPVIIRALDVYKATRGDKGVVSLAGVLRRRKSSSENPFTIWWHQMSQERIWYALRPKLLPVLCHGTMERSKTI